MRKGKLVREDGKYFAEYQNIRIDITEDARIMLREFSDEFYEAFNKAYAYAHQDDNKKLERYAKICELASQDIMGVQA